MEKPPITGLRRPCQNFRSAQWQVEPGQTLSFRLSCVTKRQKVGVSVLVGDGASNVLINPIRSITARSAERHFNAKPADIVDFYEPRKRKLSCYERAQLIKSGVGCNLLSGPNFGAIGEGTGTQLQLFAFSFPGIKLHSSARSLAILPTSRPLCCLIRC